MITSSSSLEGATMVPNPVGDNMRFSTYSLSIIFSSLMTISQYQRKHQLVMCISPPGLQEEQVQLMYISYFKNAYVLCWCTSKSSEYNLIKCAGIIMRIIGYSFFKFDSKNYMALTSKI